MSDEENMDYDYYNSEDENENMYYDEHLDYDQGNNFGYNDLERVGIGHPLIRNCNRPENAKEKLACSLFIFNKELDDLIDINSVLNYLQETLTERDCEYKNGKAFLYGWYVNDNGNINKTKLKKIKTQISTHNISTEDVIRYTRFINMH